jgi:hypothetical protein
MLAYERVSNSAVPGTFQVPVAPAAVKKEEKLVKEKPFR